MADKLKLIRRYKYVGVWGYSKWGLKYDGIIVGQIAVYESPYGKTYTAFYPDAVKGEWIYKEFSKFREALKWLKEEIKKKEGLL